MSNPYIKIIVEANIPYVKGLLDPYATVEYLAPEDFTPKAVRDADALLIRTRTKCNAELLNKSKVKLIATATIGTDHIDLQYCKDKGITVVNAPGCNAPAVAQYVFASLLSVVNRPIGSHTIGIVGVGNVGSLVAKWAESLGMKILLCDPLRQAAEGGDQWTDLDAIAREADIITFHTPLTHSGEHATYHLADGDFFAKLRRAPIIINSSRGEVVDTQALIDARKAGRVSRIIMDCWEGEPAINPTLLAMAHVATPHIAGYSSEGKVRASQVVIDAATNYFMLPRITVPMPLPPAAAQSVRRLDVIRSYDPSIDTQALKAHPENFEALRNHYSLRTETREGSEH